jgi:hypothetical protein
MIAHSVQIISRIGGYVLASPACSPTETVLTNLNVLHGGPTSPTVPDSREGRTAA